jgi:serine/threonine protein kinase
MLAHSKLVSQREYNLYKLAHDLGITPEILSIEEVDDEILLSTALYPYTLALLYKLGRDTHAIELDVMYLLSRLHNKGIIHGDVHGANIVISLEGNVRLIDFGDSFYMHEMTNEIKLAYRNSNKVREADIISEYVGMDELTARMRDIKLFLIKWTLQKGYIDKGTAISDL